MNLFPQVWTIDIGRGDIPTLKTCIEIQGQTTVYSDMNMKSHVTEMVMFES